MPETWISPEMAAAVGRELGTRTSFPIAASDIRRWAIAVHYPDLPPRLYWDEAYAATTSFGGIVAPQEFNPFAWMTADALEPDGLRPRGGMVPEPPLGIDPPGTTNMIHGGISCTYGVRMRPDDVITATSSLVDYHEREGRLGLMLFTTTEQRWTNQEGELVKAERYVVIRY